MYDAMAGRGVLELHKSYQYYMPRSDKNIYGAMERIDCIDCKKGEPFIVTVVEDGIILLAQADPSVA